MENYLEILKIETFLIKQYNYVLSNEEREKVHKEAKIIYKMLKENIEYFEENDVSYHLSKEVKEYIINKVLI